MPDVFLSFCVIVYNLYYCCYAKTSSSAVQKRHSLSKVYGNPIAPSFYSILLACAHMWTITIRTCVDCTVFTVSLSPKLINRVSLWNLVLKPGFHEWGLAVLWISIFLLGNIIFFQFVYILHFFESIKSKSTQMLRPQKRKLRSFVQRYSL